MKIKVSKFASNRSTECDKHFVVMVTKVTTATHGPINFQSISKMMCVYINYYDSQLCEMVKQNLCEWIW